MSDNIYLRHDGTLVATEYADPTGQIWSWKNIVAITAFEDIAGLRDDGTVVSTGHDVTGWKNIAAISMGSNFLMGLKQDGTVCVSDGGAVTQADIADWNNIIAISAGTGCCLGIRSDGTVASFINPLYEKDYSGVCDVLGWKDIQAIATQSFITAGLMKNGHVLVTGKKVTDAMKSAVQSWTDVEKIAVGEETVYAIHYDGSLSLFPQPNVYEYNQSRGDEYDPIIWNNLSDISVGNYHILGLCRDGSVIEMGGGVYGLDVVCSLGVKTPQHQYYPEIVDGGLSCYNCGHWQDIPEYNPTLAASCLHDFAKTTALTDTGCIFHHYCTKCGYSIDYELVLNT